MPYFTDADAALDALKSKNVEQDARILVINSRLDALESKPPVEPPIEPPSVLTRVDPQVFVDDMFKDNEIHILGMDLPYSWYAHSDIQMGLKQNPAKDSAVWTDTYGKPQWDITVKVPVIWTVAFPSIVNTAINVPLIQTRIALIGRLTGTDKWDIIIPEGPVQVGNFYPLGSIPVGTPSDAKPFWSETAGRVQMIIANNHAQYHTFAQNGGNDIEPGKYDCLFTYTFAKTDGSGDYGLQVGMDWYKGHDYPNDYAGGTLVSRTKKLTNKWQAFGGLTLLDVPDKCMNPQSGLITAAEFIRTCPAIYYPMD